MMRYNNHMEDPISAQKICSTKYPDLTFKIGQRFSFTPPRTITLGPKEPFYSLLVLHELGHALCKHNNFITHIRRLAIEREAWDKARDLPHEFGIEFNEDFAESQLDTYRNWLHSKSKCKKCGLTRYQTDDGRYHCPYCDI